MEEIWKDIPGFELVYEVSNFGRIRKNEHEVAWLTRNGKLAKRTFPAMIRKLQNTYDKKYLGVCLRHKYNMPVHRLVAKIFIPNPENKPMVNHIDGNKHNNHVDNLEWCTRQENEDHAFSIGLKNSTGSHNAMAKLNEDIVKEILLFEDRSIVGKRILVEKYGIHRATIERIWNKKIWNHVSI